MSAPFSLSRSTCATCGVTMVTRLYLWGPLHATLPIWWREVGLICFFLIPHLLKSGCSPLISLLHFAWPIIGMWFGDACVLLLITGGAARDY